MKRFDYVVIGGGIVGLSTGWALMNRNPGYRIAIVEKETDWARHQTGRNSGVIHSGIYYKPGSLKASLCRKGNTGMVEFCREHGIHHEICGKLIVATDRTEMPRLRALEAQASANGINTRRLNASEVREIEPHVHCIEALHVPSTGIVDYGSVCRKLAELIGARGADLRLGTLARGFRRDGAEAVVETTAGAFSATWLINCAGLHSDRVGKLAGAQPSARIVPFRGEYYELTPARRSLVRNLVYPVPDPQFPFLGVHFTRMIDGTVHAGPNAVLSFKREGYHRTAFNLADFIDTVSFPGFWRLARRHARMGMTETYRSFNKRAFVDSLRKMIPEVNEEDLVPAAAGVRAQALRPDGRLVDDFLLEKGPAAIHVYNAPSPAATASLEIGRAIVAQLPEIS